MAEGAVGFWSYVRDDNAGDGRILDLANDLRAEFRIQTAGQLELFVDRESLQWGEEWQKRISDTIAGTTFFIPIITPSYFRSNACRQELLKFIRDASRLGLKQLLMPVYWVTVSELHEDPDNSSDEAIRAVAKYQRVDLRNERLKDRGSAEYRQAVSKLAAELAKRAAAVTETVEDAPEDDDTGPPAPGPGPEPDEGPPGLIDLLASSEAAMDRLNEVMEEIGEQIRIIGERVAGTGEEIDAAAARGQGVRAALTITERLAHELDEPTRQLEQKGHEYAAALAELDPGIHARLDLIANADERDPEHDEFLVTIEGLVDAADEALPQMKALVDTSRETATLSRSLRAPVRRMETGIQGVLDGRAVMEEWRRRARELKQSDDESSESSPGADPAEGPATDDAPPPGGSA